MAEGSVALQGEMGSVAAAGRNLSSLDSLNQAMGHLRAGIGQVQASGEAKPGFTDADSRLVISRVQ